MKHATLSGNIITFIQQEPRQLKRLTLKETPRHISELLAPCQALGFTHIWIMPDSVQDQQGYDFLQPIAGHKIFIPGERREYPHAAACHKGEKGNFEIIVNWAHASKFRWPVTRELDILATIDYLQLLFGTDVDISFSSGHIGMELLKDGALNKHYKEARRELKSDAPFRQAASELHFCKQFSLEMAGKIGHIIDKNSAHPNATQSALMGLGEPVHLTGPDIMVKRCGIYRVTKHAVNDSLFDGQRLPKIIQDQDEWVTLDVAKFAHKEGYSLEIAEAHVFEHSAVVFQNWTTGLWASRQSLRKAPESFVYEPAREIALDCVKSIMNQTVSSLRADWWANMVGMARVQRLANLKKLYEAGYEIYFGYADDILIFDEYPDLSHVPGLWKNTTNILDKKDELGGYKEKFSFIITPEIVHDINAIQARRVTQQAGEWLAFLKKQEHIDNGR